jgi:hypothetical protein
MMTREDMVNMGFSEEVINYSFTVSEFQRIYKDYTSKDIKNIKDGDKEEVKFLGLIKGLIKLKLMYTSDVNDVKGLVKEIIYFNKLMNDFYGNHEGDFSEEYYNVLEELVNGSTLSDDDKQGILNGYREYYN